jgi:nucleoside 2-deoxyribosyltransferase
MKIYLASPLGFNPEHSDYRHRITAHLQSQGHQLFDPWEQQHAEQAIADALNVKGSDQREKALAEAADYTGRMNAAGIDDSDVLLAVLDGTEPDSGTVAELGYAAGKGKLCYGLRTDRRDSGDLPGLAINLQVLYFITSSGGSGRWSRTCLA